MEKKNNLLVVILVGLLFFSCSSIKDEEISGTVKDGIRTISVNVNALPNLTVYRGDYIILNLESDRSLPFKVDNLGIDIIVPKTDEPRYIKIKETGVFDYYLGKENATLTVLDYSSGVKYTEVSVEEAVNLINSINPYVLDVRTPDEYGGGHIVGAKLLPVQVLKENLNKVDSPKDDAILVYCHSGSRSTVASRILIKAGYTKVYNLRRGISGWKASGRPVSVE